MARDSWLCVLIIGPILLAAAFLRGQQSGGEQAPDRYAALVRQLGDVKFLKRDEAARELEMIGEPARKALEAGMMSDDREISDRAGNILEILNVRARLAAAKKELAKWQGEWIGNGGQRLVIKGDLWTWGDGSDWKFDETKANRLKVRSVGPKSSDVDLWVGDPAADGKLCRAIFHIDGDTLHYCGTYAIIRPTEFRSQGDNFYVAWKRKADGKKKEPTKEAPVLPAPGPVARARVEVNSPRIVAVAGPTEPRPLRQGT